MPAYDNVSLPGAPDIARAGNYAQLLMQGLENLPKQYWSGQEQGYQQKQRNLFSEGLPTDASGKPDFYTTLQKMIQAGGSPVAGQVLPMLQKQPFLDAALKEYQAESGQGANTGPAASTAAGSPASITGQTRQASTSAQPQLSATGSDSAGAETVRSLTAGIANGRNVPDASIANYARALGVDPDQPLSAAQEARARTIIGNNLRGGSQPMGSASTGGISAPTAPKVNPVPQAGGTAGDDNNTNQGTPVGATGGPPISPAPTAASGNIGGAPAASFDWRFAGAATAGGAAGMVPPGYDPRTYAEALKRRAEALRRQANTQGIIGIPTKAKEDQAAALDRQADAIFEQLGKPSNITPEMRNVGAIPGGRPAEELKGEIASGQKEFDAITELGNAARVSNQKVQLASAFLNSDEYYSGPIEGLNRKIKQWTATLGGNPNIGQPQEAFNKTINDLLSEQIRAMAKSGVGRVLMTEVQTMRDSIASQKITPATNRLLLEEVNRVHKAQMEIQDAATAYKEKHGHLDAGFQRIVAAYYRDHPLFSTAELKDPRLIAPPVAPPGMDPVKAKAWMKSRGLASGDPIKTQDGRVMWVP